MKAVWVGFAGNNHSWSVTAQNICRSLIKLGHTVDLFSTNGIEYLPEDLMPYVIGYGIGTTNNVIGRLPDNSYDMCLSYTAMKNFNRYLSYSMKNRFGIWTYEFAGSQALPIGFAKQHIFCDQILSPSTFAKQIFIDSGIPENKISIIPHGVNMQEINAAIPYKLKTTKSTKILINLGQLHRRKNLGSALEIFGKAFTKNDDVCLILKIADNKPKQQFEISFKEIYDNFIKIFPNHADIEIIRDFIPNIYSLYKSCNINFTATNCEAFGMPQLESLACGLTNVAPRYGGYLDFLNDDNSYLINGSIFNVPGNYLYYQCRNGLQAFRCDIFDGVKKLQEAVSNRMNINQLKTLNEYNWSMVVEKILQLTI